MEERSVKNKMEYFTITDTETGSGMRIGGFCLNRFEPDENTRNQIENEAEAWEIGKVTTDSEVLYWENNRERTDRYLSRFSGFGNAVVRDGHFAGVVINVREIGRIDGNQELGLLLTDGTRAGKTSDYLSHEDEELYGRESAVFSLERKEN